MQKITPFLWFNTNVEEAIAFYTLIFKDSKVSEMGEIMGGSNPEGRERAIQAMMHMTKLNIKELQDAYNGK